MLILPFVLLGGFYLQDQNPPVYLIWLKEMSMFNWGFKLMVINQFHGKTKDQKEIEETKKREERASDFGIGEY